jgi:hypothetical protein
VEWMWVMKKKSDGNIIKAPKELDDDLKELFHIERIEGTIWAKVRKDESDSAEFVYADFRNKMWRRDMPLTYFEPRAAAPNSNEVCKWAANLELLEPNIWRESEIIPFDKSASTTNEIKLACYVVTMPKRCGEVTKRLFNSGLPCAILGALDGTGLYPQPNLKVTGLASLSQHGCFESERRALQTFISLPLDVATHVLILDDDVLLPDGIMEHTLTRLRLLTNYDPGWSLYYLIYTHEVHPDDTRRILKGHNIYKAHTPLGTAAYVSTRAAAAIILRESMKRVIPIDERYQLLIKNEIIKAYIVWPSPVSYVNTASTVWSGSLDAIPTFTTGRLFRQQKFTCCCRNEQSSSICAYRQHCNWDPLTPNCQYLREEDAINICKRECERTYRDITPVCG